MDPTVEADRPTLARLFAAETIAIIGASRDPTKWGSRVGSNLLRGGFRGRVLGVNPNADRQGEGALELVRSLDEIDEAVDCAFVALPAQRTTDAIAACAVHGVKFAMVVAAGFAEMGPDGGRAEDELLETSRRSGMRLIGPNCYGFYSGSSRINLMPRSNIRSGSIALATQSGYVALELFELAERAGLGFSRCIGLGNQVDLGFGETLHAFARDPETSAVALYIEGIPARDGDLVKNGLLACADADKPVIVLKVGTSAQGAATAQTHTNSLVGSDRIWDAVLSNTGALRVSSTEEAIDYLQAATRLRRHNGRCAVLTDGGGSSIMVVDAVARDGLTLAALSEKTQQMLTPLVPPLAPRPPGLNPITLDTPGGMEDDPRLLAQCARAVAADPGVDVVLIAGGLGAYASLREQESETVAALTELVGTGTRLAVQSALIGSRPAALTKLKAAGIPLFETIPRMVSAVASRRVAVRDAVSAEVDSLRPDTAHASGSFVSPDDAFSLLEKHGARTPPTYTARSLDALEALSGFAFPRCLKVVDPAVVHKSDSHAVLIELKDASAFRAGAIDLWGRFPNASLLVMPSFPTGLELLVGCHTDPTFGPIVTFGRGGIWAETEDDVALVVGPATAADVDTALRRLRVAPRLYGGRGRPSLAVNDFCSLVVCFSELAQRHPDLDLEVNPVILYEDRYELADIRAFSTSTPPELNEREMVKWNQ